VGAVNIEARFKVSFVAELLVGIIDLMQTGAVSGLTYLTNEWGITPLGSNKILIYREKLSDCLNIRLTTVYRVSSNQVGTYPCEQQ